MGQFSDQLIDVSRTLVRRAAPQQGGLFAGLNPATYNASDPLPLWIIQVVIIIATTQLLYALLSRIRQPRVISEIIGGVILGPSIMGRIPGFRQTIFPDESLPMLTLTSTIGLVLFLFIVGMEIDARVIRRNFKASMAISAAGLIFPLGLGAALGVGIYKEFVADTVNFGYFILFTAVAIGITAFPVLCRILTECKLLDTNVGVVVLSAGVGNDVIGWVLLALSVALVNAANGLQALYVLITGVAYTLFLLYPVRWGFVWMARRTGSLETGQPTTSMMTVTLLVVFISAFFTDVIGIHPIFGGFLAGLIIPHKNGFSIAVVEKLEDLVSVILLPLYFTLSGLRTDLGLLDNGITWGYTILICTVAFFSKFLACSITARFAGFNFRESTAIGALMSCKGLVELIVLNVGLQAGILDTRIFSMFVVHALILTFVTTPLTLWAYPARVRTRVGPATEHRSEGNEGIPVRSSTTTDEFKSRFAVILDKFEQTPAAMAFTQLIQFLPHVSDTSSVTSEFVKADSPSPSLRSLSITVAVLRLIELTDRTSAVLKYQAADVLLHNDPVLSIFRTFGRLSRISVNAVLAVIGYDDFATIVSKHALETQSHMVVIPWSKPPSNATDEPGQAHNPFEGIFYKSGSESLISSVVTSDYIRRVFASSPVDVALFIDRGVSCTIMSAGQHLLVPFFGGPDDRLALSFAIQICINPGVTATFVKVAKDATVVDDVKSGLANSAHATVASPDTVYGATDAQTQLASTNADRDLWDRFASRTERPDDINRVTFHEEFTSRPLHTVLDYVGNETNACIESSRTLIVVLGRSRRMATDVHNMELRQILGEHGSPLNGEVPKTVGDIGSAMVAAGVNASLLVLHSNIASDQQGV